MSSRLHGWVCVLVLPWACNSDPVVAPDATRYEVRDAVVDPRPDTGLDVFLSNDGTPQVDVIPFDAPNIADASINASDDVPVTCQDIADRYVENVRAAQACTAATDCTTVVCETPCCTCQVYLRAGNPAYARLDDLRTRWTAMDCATVLGCPATPCQLPEAAACSSLGRCVTVRAVGDGGL